MPKVIQFIKSKLELHRGKKSISSNPYSYRSNLKRKEKRVLNWTLDSFHLSPRCSSTYPLNFSFRKKSSAKETSKNFETKVNSVSKFNYEITNQKYARILGSASAIAFVLLLTLTVLPVVHNDDSADAATGTATQSSTTVSVSTATASVDLTATSTDGTFATSTGSGIASFDVTTTNYTGYTLTIGADDDDGTLTNGSGGTFTSISSVMDEKTFDDSTYNGYWGYKPSKMNGVENVGFWPSPTTTATTLDTTKVANATANTYTIALGARASASQAAGTYSKTVTITATSNPANYSITYADNTGKAATNLPDATTSTTSGTSIALSNVTPSKIGFVFGGWCSTAPTVAADYTTTCSGTTYQAGGTYGIDQTTANTVTLYALWAIPTYNISIKPSVGISSVTLNTATCTNSDPATAGDACTVSNLVYGQSYTLTATAASGYTFATWSNNGVGTIGSGAASDIQNATTTFTVGEGSSTIVATTLGGTYPLTITFAGSGVSSVQVRTAAGTGGALVGTVSTSGGSITGLIAGEAYYLYPIFSSTNYAFSSWANTGGKGYLSCAMSNTCSEDDNPIYIPQEGSGAVTITGKSVTLGECSSADTCIQYYTKSMCQTNASSTPVTLTDARDGYTYRVRYINGNCWMVDNLLFGYDSTNPDSYVLTMNSETSNIPSIYTEDSPLNLPVLDVVSNGTVNSGYCYGGLDSSVSPAIMSGGAGVYSCIHSGTISASNAPYSDVDLSTVWYNYAAVTAGIITGSYNAVVSSYDICPAGWRLPVRSEALTIGSNDWNNPSSSYVEEFLTVYGGTYRGNVFNDSDNVSEWATANTSNNNVYNGSSRAVLYVRNGGLTVNSDDRAKSTFVRCVRN